MAAADYFEVVQQFYVGYYGRPGDPDGVEFWAGKVDEAGGSFTAVQEAFATSDEAQAFVFNDPDTGEAYTSEELVDNIFQNLFGRDADDAGSEFYTTRLDDGTFTLGTIVKRVIDGAQNEDATTIDNKVEVAQYFTDNLGDKQYTEDDITDARALLDGIDETDASVTDAQAEVDTFIEDQSTAPGEEGDTFDLTPGPDALVGTANNDTFQADAQTNQISGDLEDTFQSVNSINGGAGSDTLDAQLGSDGTVSFVGAAVSNVENFEFTSFTAASGMDMANADCDNRKVIRF